MAAKTTSSLLTWLRLRSPVKAGLGLTTTPVGVVRSDTPARSRPAGLQFREHLPALLYGVAAVLIGGLTAAALSFTSDPWLRLGMVMGIGAVVGVFVRLEVGLLALMGITYTSLSNVLIHNYAAPSIAQPFIVLILGVIGVRWILYGDAPLNGWGRPALLFGAYGLVGLVSLMHAADMQKVVDGLDDYFKNALIALVIIWLLRRASSLRRVVWVLLMVGLFMGTISVYQEFTGTYENTYWGFAQSFATEFVSGVIDRRIGGPLGDPNFYAQILVMLVPLALDRFWNEKNWLLRVLAAGTLAVCTLSIFLTFSRGGFIALMVVLGLMFTIRPPKLPALLMGILTLIIAFQFLPAKYSLRISSLLDFIPGVGQDFRNDESFRGRAGEMLAAWQMFHDSPILGVGVGNYNANYLDYSVELGLDWRREDRSAHSLYLELAAERGLLGLVLFAAIVGLGLYSLQRGYHDFVRAGLTQSAHITFALGVSLAGYLTTAVFLHDAHSRYFWLMIGLAYAAAIVARHELTLRQASSESGLA